MILVKRDCGCVCPDFRFFWDSLWQIAKDVGTVMLVMLQSVVTWEADITKNCHKEIKSYTLAYVSVYDFISLYIKFLFKYNCEDILA